MIHKIDVGHIVCSIPDSVINAIMDGTHTHKNQATIKVSIHPREQIKFIMCVYGLHR